MEEQQSNDLEKFLERIKYQLNQRESLSPSEKRLLSALSSLTSLLARLAALKEQRVALDHEVIRSASDQKGFTAKSAKLLLDNLQAISKSNHWEFQKHHEAIIRLYGEVFDSKDKDVNLHKVLLALSSEA